MAELVKYIGPAATRVVVQIPDEPKKPAAKKAPATKPAAKKAAEKKPAAKKRARKGGKFVADDPSTPDVNEAYEQ